MSLVAKDVVVALRVHVGEAVATQPLLLKIDVIDTYSTSYFAIHVINLWNSHPADHVDCSSIFYQTPSRADLFYTVFIVLPWLILTILCIA